MSPTTTTTRPAHMRHSPSRGCGSQCTPSTSGVCTCVCGDTVVDAVARFMVSGVVVVFAIVADLECHGPVKTVNKLIYLLHFGLLMRKATATHSHTHTHARVLRLVVFRLIKIIIFAMRAMHGSRRWRRRMRRRSVSKVLRSTEILSGTGVEIYVCCFNLYMWTV